MQVAVGVQGVTCDGPDFCDTGGSGDGLQEWQRAGNYFLGGANYPLYSLPILSCGFCVQNTQTVEEHALH